MKSFKIITLGCKVNQCESDSLATLMQEAHWWQAPESWPAELCIINTCTVTGKASMQSRQAVRHAVRENPGACIVVTGCYAQTESAALKNVEGIHLIIGHGDKHRLVRIVDSYLKEKTPYAVDEKNLETEHRPFLPPSLHLPKTMIPRVFIGDVRHAEAFAPIPAIPNGNRSRPSLKIQDGCDAFCSYCIVPYARGRSRSMPMPEVMANLERLAAAGFREVVLSGIHLGCYGRDLAPRTDLATLLQRIEAQATIDRIRLSSIEPLELTEAIIDLVAGGGRFCPHVHLPLQSGDNGVLKRMRRPYTREVFRDVVLAVHEKIPGAAIGVDALIGFPGESEEAFANTYDLLDALPVGYLHVFPFSPRKGTPAAGYADTVLPEVVKERCGRVRALGHAKRKAFYRQTLGKTLDVLVEKERDRETGLLKGVSACYRTVLLEGGDGLKNRIVQVCVERVWPGKLAIGSLTDSLFAR